MSTPGTPVADQISEQEIYTKQNRRSRFLEAKTCRVKRKVIIVFAASIFLCLAAMASVVGALELSIQALRIKGKPVSGCTTKGNYVASSGNVWNYHCNANNGGSDQNRFYGFQPDFESCITLCDSWDYWNQKNEITVAVYNWAGILTQSPGMCWCKVLAPEMWVHEDGSDVAVLLQPERNQTIAR